MSEETTKARRNRPWGSVKATVLLALENNVTVPELSLKTGIHRSIIYATEKNLGIKLPRCYKKHPKGYWDNRPSKR